jgi:hypothetical protein
MPRKRIYLRKLIKGAGVPLPSFLTISPAPLLGVQGSKFKVQGSWFMVKLPNFPGMIKMTLKHEEVY